MITMKGVAAFATCAVLAWGPSVGAAQPQRYTEVGFAAGETTTGCPSAEPSFCPRDLTNYPPALWDALRSTHGVLYLDIAYRADFGPPRPSMPQRTDVIPL